MGKTSKRAQKTRRPRAAPAERSEAAMGKEAFLVKELARTNKAGRRQKSLEGPASERLAAARATERSLGKEAIFGKRISAQKKRGGRGPRRLSVLRLPILRKQN